MLIVLLALAALAGEPEPVPLTPEEAAQRGAAEYYRLSQTLVELASRNAWAGVERTFLALVATGVPPSFDDLLTAAHAARSIGNTAAVRARLLQANGLHEDPSVLDWLYELDNAYGTVSLAGNVGVVSLQPATMPFNPDQVASVTFAQRTIEETGVFDGLLPQGTYTFSDREIVVRPRVSTVKIDVRTDEKVKRRPKP